MQHYLLALIYTYKCTASCDICCFSCSPEREEKMSLSDAKRYVSEAKKCGVKMVGIAGGEPLIFFDEIIELAKYTKSLGMNITLTTNCFWAESYNISLEILETLRNAGINHIKISSDEFHGKYIPYENIKNVLNAAKNINLKVVVGCTVTKNSDRLRGLLSHIEDESTGTILLEQTCYPLGRAKEYFKEDQFIYKKNIDRFCKDGGMITITPDGSVYPCGSMFSIISNRLVGSMCEYSYELIAKKVHENKHNKFISKYGIKPYYEYIIENNLPINIKKEFVDSCHACYELFNNDQNIQYLDDIVDRLEKVYG